MPPHKGGSGERRKGGGGERRNSAGPQASKVSIRCEIAPKSCSTLLKSRQVVSNLTEIVRNRTQLD